MPQQLCVDQKSRAFFQLLTRGKCKDGKCSCSRQDSGPELPFEVMGMVQFNTAGGIESVRVRFGEADENAPRAQRPHPHDVRSHGEVAYHTHFYDKDRKFNPPTKQDIVMFVCYRAYSQLMGLPRPREAELVFATEGVYVMRDAPGKAASHSCVLSALANLQNQGRKNVTAKDVEACAYQAANALFGEKYSDDLMGMFAPGAPYAISIGVEKGDRGLMGPDQTASEKNTPFMQDKKAMLAYIKLFEKYGVEVTFTPWESKKICFQVDKAVLYPPLNGDGSM